MTTTTQKSVAVTSQYDFHPATQEGTKMFSVRAGIPLTDAFNELSLLLGASHSAIESAAVGGGDGTDPQWSVVHLMDFSYALVQAMHHGLVVFEKEGAEQ